MKKKPAPTITEEQMQTQLFQLAAIHEAHIPDLRWLHAVPNGGKRSPSEAARFKSAGVKAGVPDIDLPVSSRDFCGLRIEMKRQGQQPTKNQMEWIEGLRQLGHCVQVCHSLDLAWAVLLWYLAPRNHVLSFRLLPTAPAELWQRRERIFNRETNEEFVARDAVEAHAFAYFYNEQIPRTITD